MCGLTYGLCSSDCNVAILLKIQGKPSYHKHGPDSTLKTVIFKILSFEQIGKGELLIIPHTHIVYLV